MKKLAKKLLKKLQKKPHECRYSKHINLLYCEDCGDVIYPIHTTMRIRHEQNNNQAIL
jgi:RNase P subunit RPR2